MLIDKTAKTAKEKKLAKRALKATKDKEIAERTKLAPETIEKLALFVINFFITNNKCELTRLNV